MVKEISICLLIASFLGLLFEWFNQKIYIMKKNMGSADKIIRVIIAVAIAILYFTTDYISGTLGTILLVMAAIFTLTSIVGVCPLYIPFGIDTGSGNKKK